MPSVNPIDFSFHLKKNDLLPPIKIELTEDGTTTPFDLTNFTGKFFMALSDDLTTAKVDGSAVTITDAANGKAEYRWSGTDTDTEGKFQFEFRFTSASKTFSVPVVSPGVVVVEVAIG